MSSPFRDCAELYGAAGQGFPYFEVLIKVKGRSASPRDTALVVSRVLGK